MAMNSRPDDPADETSDPRIARLYRETAREEPPRHLDAHLVEAARTEAAAARADPGSRLPAPRGGPRARFAWPWRVSLAFAAVAVLSVSLVLLNPRAPDSPAPAFAPPTDPAESSVAHERRAAAEPTAKAQRAPAQKRELDSSDALRDRAEPQAQPAERPAAAPAAPRAAQSSEQQQARKGYAEFANAPQAAAQAKVGAATALAREYANEPPEKWGEKIRELRQQGRIEEADGLLTAFKARFPGYPVPEAWLK